MMIHKVKLPALPLPTHPKIHPHFDTNNPLTNRFEVAGFEYCDRFRLYQNEEQRNRLAMTGCSRLAALIFPKVSDELLQISTDFMIWTVAYDDEYCDEGPLSNDPANFNRKACEILRAVDCPEEPAYNGDRYAMAIQDIRRRMDQLAKPAQVARFVEMFRWYVTSEMLLINNLKPSLNEYLSARLYNAGGVAFPVLAHIIADVDITQNEYEDRRVRAMLEIAALLGVLDSDMYAYGKEIARAANDHHRNLFLILQRDLHCSLEEAIQHYMEMRWRMISLFQRLHEEISKTGSPGICEFLDGLALYYTGAAVWIVSNCRYASISGLTDNELVEAGGITHECPPESFGSIGIPACEWWWTYDPARR